MNECTITPTILLSENGYNPHMKIIVWCHPDLCPILMALRVPEGS